MKLGPSAARISVGTAVPTSSPAFLHRLNGLHPPEFRNW
jgi:hypothetical protein